MASKTDIEEARTIAQEPNWLNGDLEIYPETESTMSLDKNASIQQSDLLKPLLMDIAEHGLPYAYSKFLKQNPSDYKCSTATNPKKVIIVGAGMAGLVAGFELQRAGHEVEILEMTQRIGGRVKTFGEKEGFAKELYVDGKILYCCFSVSIILWHAKLHPRSS